MGVPSHATTFNLRQVIALLRELRSRQHDAAADVADVPRGRSLLAVEVVAVGESRRALPSDRFAQVSDAVAHAMDDEVASLIGWLDSAR